MVAAYDPKQD